MLPSLCPAMAANPSVSRFLGGMRSHCSEWRPWPTGAPVIIVRRAAAHIGGDRGSSPREILACRAPDTSAVFAGRRTANAVRHAANEGVRGVVPPGGAPGGAPDKMAVSAIGRATRLRLILGFHAGSWQHRYLDCGTLISERSSAVATPNVAGVDGPPPGRSRQWQAPAWWTRCSVER
jgi:hypothetical protein